MEYATQNSFRKPLRFITGKIADWSEFAKYSVSFANGAGGCIRIGVDETDTPPQDQLIAEAVAKRAHKRILELTMNVAMNSQVKRANNGGEYLEILVDSSLKAAYTTSGRYYIPVAKSCVAIVGGDILRLAKERPGFRWESTAGSESISNVDSGKIAQLCERIRSANKIDASVREKSDSDLLFHYDLAVGSVLTSLGVLMLGTASARRGLGIAPVLRVVRYDESDAILENKLIDDYIYPLHELLDVACSDSYDLHADVLCELVVNAFVHRPYSQEDEICVSIYPDRVEVQNAGRLPLGVTVHNALHAHRIRNVALVRIFCDLGLMAGTGQGYNFLYDKLLSSGRSAPTIEEGPDGVRVSVERHVSAPHVAELIAEASAEHALTQRERITLAILANNERMSAQEISNALDIDVSEEFNAWLGRLLEFDLVVQIGKPAAHIYAVNPELRPEDLTSKGPPLERIDPVLLRNFVHEDVMCHLDATDTEIGRRIRERIVAKITARMIKRALGELDRAGLISVNKTRNQWRYDPRENAKE